MNSTAYHRKVGTIRPSHLMYTAGVGGLVDLPNLSVLVTGIDGWRDEGQDPIHEERLLAAVNHELRTRTVAELRPAPWRPDLPGSRNTRNIGVPVVPFPQWYRCTGCDELSALDTNRFEFENRVASKPHEARFVHPSGSDPRNDNGHRKPRLAVPARFVLACPAGHLDDFPYVPFVHKGGTCRETRWPTLRMRDHGGNLGANVTIRCDNCGVKRNIREAMGDKGVQNLPRCRGRHPHLDRYEDCDRQPKLLVLGASNQWFGRNLSVLAVPGAGTDRLTALLTKQTSKYDKIKSLDNLKMVLDFQKPAELRDWDAEEIWDALQHVRRAREHGEAADRQRADIRTPEWKAFTHKPVLAAQRDFALNDSGGVPERLRTLFDDVVQVERLREVRALIGFTRLETPDPEDPDSVTIAPISRSNPTWVPASEVRGEGLFLRVSENLLTDWENRTADEPVVQAHRDAYGRYRQNRRKTDAPTGFAPYAYWPGPRYIALHTLSHLLIRAISLECGYSSASLSERIYAGDETDPRSGILIYTAVSDAEGSLGGLVSLGAPEKLDRIVLRALRDATQCSSDPLCAERTPQYPAAFLHGAACHVCTFVSETTCERGNRFLDRRLVVPFEPSKLALLHDTDILDLMGHM